MPRKSAGGAKSSAKRRRMHNPDDAPELDDAFFARAEIVKNGTIVQRGRPRLGKTKPTA